MIELRRLQPDDAPLLKSVRLRALQDAPRAFGSTYAREAAFSDDEWSQRTRKWSDAERASAVLALDRGEACGIAGGFVDETDASRAHLVSMWVAPSLRRQGVGRRLVEMIEAWARQRAASQLVLMVTEGNDTALRFYRRLGFSMTDKTIDHPAYADLCEHQMVKALH